MEADGARRLAEDLGDLAFSLAGGGRGVGSFVWVVAGTGCAFVFSWHALLLPGAPKLKCTPGTMHKWCWWAINVTLRTTA